MSLFENFKKLISNEISYREFSEINFDNKYTIKLILEQYYKQHSRFLFVNYQGEEMIILLHFDLSKDRKEISNAIEIMEKIHSKKVYEIYYKLEWEKLNITLRQRIVFYNASQDLVYNFITFLIIGNYFFGKNKYEFHFKEYKFKINDMECEFGHYILPNFLLENVKEKEIEQYYISQLNFRSSQNFPLRLRYAEDKFYYHTWNHLRINLKNHPCFENLIKGKKINFMHFYCNFGTEIYNLYSNEILGEGSFLKGLTTKKCISWVKENNYNNLIEECDLLNSISLNCYFEKTKIKYDLVYIDTALDILEFECQEILIQNARSFLSRTGRLIGRIKSANIIPPDFDYLYQTVNGTYYHNSESLKKLLLKFFRNVKIICSEDEISYCYVLYFESY